MAENVRSSPEKKYTCTHVRADMTSLSWWRLAVTSVYSAVTHLIHIGRVECTSRDQVFLQIKRGKYFSLTTIHKFPPHSHYPRLPSPAHHPSTHLPYTSPPPPHTPCSLPHDSPATAAGSYHAHGLSRGRQVQCSRYGTVHSYGTCVHTVWVYSGSPHV